MKALAYLCEVSICVTCARYVVVDSKTETSLNYTPSTAFSVGPGIK